MIIPTKSIKIEKAESSTKRFRKDFGDIQKMSESLRAHGLIHPIVVTIIDPTLNDGKQYSLIAGERRLTAALLLGWTEIEATEKKDLSEIKIKEIELEENIQRKDINWMEQAEAVRQLDALKRKLHGSRVQGPTDGSGWSQADTAESIGASKATVSQDIQLAEDLASDPKLRARVSEMPKSAARNYIKREKQTKKMKRQLEKKEIMLSSDLVYGKCQDLIKALPDKSIDLLITDPPWGVSDIQAVADGNLSGQYSNNGKNIGNADEMLSTYEKLIPELFRVLSPGAHVYIFFAPDWYFVLRDLFEKHGFNINSVPLIWPKYRTTMVPNPYHYIPSYEMILFGCKNPQTRTLLHPKPNCLLDHPAIAPVKRIHSLQKPLSLMSMFIENSSLIGETIFDPFAGSGVVLKAAKALGRKGIGFESDEENFYSAQAYLAKEEN